PQVRPPASPAPFPYTPLFRSEGLRPAQPVDPGLDGSTTPAGRPPTGGLLLTPSAVRGGNSSPFRAAAQPRGPVSRGHVNRPKRQDRKSTRLNSSHDQISYAVF